MITTKPNSETINDSEDNDEPLFPIVDEAQQTNEEEQSQDLRNTFKASNMPATTLDADLAQLFEDVLGLEIDSEVVVSLIERGYDEWQWFKWMEVEEVNELKKSDGKGRFVPCMKSERIEYLYWNKDI